MRTALLAACLVAALACPAGASAALQELTEAERTWLARNPVVRVGLDRAGAPPYDVPGSDGSHYGLSIDLLRRIANRLEIQLELRTYPDRAAALSAARRHEVDVVPSVQRSVELARDLLFTHHYAYSHPVLLKHPNFAGTAIPVVAYVRGRQPADALAARLPRFRGLEVADAKAGMEALAASRVQAFAVSIVSVQHALGAEAAATLENLREEVLDAGELRFAVRADRELLAGALDKGVNSFTPAEIGEIARTWNAASGAAAARLPPLVIRDDERRRLDRMQRLRVAYDADFEPFSFVQGGEPAGMSIDYARAAAERLGIQLEFLRGQTFGGALDAVVEGNADLLVAAARTPERRRYLRFAGPTFSQPTVLITRLDTEQVGGLGELEAHTVALPEGHFLRERLAREHPRVQVATCRDSEDCLKAVVDKRAMATLGNLAVLSTLIERSFPGRLRVAGTIPDSPSELYLAIATGEPELQSLLQRALDGMPPDRHAQIRSRWRTAQYQEGISIARVLQVALPVLVVVTLVLGLIAFSNRRLAREVGRRRAVEEELRAARDRAQAATQAKSSFLAMMSHEIRTPMQGVLGILDVLGHTALTHDQQGLVRTAGGSARSLMALLNDLLDFSKIEAGKMRIEPAPASLHAVAQDAISLFTMQASEKGIALTLGVDPSVAPAHRFDALRVGQVLANLVSNAIKFTAQGEVAVRIAARDEPPDGQRVTIRVRDSGIGIDAAAQARLFAPFEQAESSTTRRYGGTGLGLAICRSIAELMGAELTLASTVGEGSTFTFAVTLPLAPHAALAPAAPAAGDAPASARILVVEDHPVNQLVVRRQLERLGHVVVVAGDGAQGLEAWRAGGFDLVLADHHMPVMDGEEMLRRLREEESRRPDARRTPVLGLSADGRESMTGVDALLLKPLVTSDLQRALAEWLPRLAQPAAACETSQAVRDAVLDERLLWETFAEAGAIADTLAALGETLVADVHAARRALLERRMEEARRMAHRILGAARAVGAARLADTAQALQQAAGSNDFAAAVAAFEALEAARAEVDAAIGQTRQRIR